VEDKAHSIVSAARHTREYLRLDRCREAGLHGYERLKENLAFDPDGRAALRCDNCARHCGCARDQKYDQKCSGRPASH
jgi:hypothetical protein